jgi:hypothetical protein
MAFFAFAICANAQVVYRLGSDDILSQSFMTQANANNLILGLNSSNASSRLSLSVLDEDLAAIGNLTSNGIAVRTGNNSWTQRVIQGTINYITLTNNNGVSGDPTINIGPNVVTTDTAQTITANKTFSQNLIVNGNANIGDAAGDSHTIRGNMRGQDQTSAFADSYMTRQNLPMESIMGIWSFTYPISASSVVLENNGTFLSPVVSSGIRFQGGSGSANGTYNGATITLATQGPGSGNIITPTSNLAWEFTYAQGTNDGTVFTALLGTNNRRDLTAAGFGVEIATSTGALTLKAHNGTSQSTMTVSDAGGNLFFRRYILVWRAATNTVELYRASMRGTTYERPALMTSVSISAPSAWSSGSIRFGLFATATVPSGQDSYINNVVIYQY